MNCQHCGALIADNDSPPRLTAQIQTLHMISDPDDEDLLKILREKPDHALADHELSDRTSCGEPTVFHEATQLLSAGEPICFSSCSGWKDSAGGTEDVYFWYTQDPKDLEEMTLMIRRKIESFQEMLVGAEIARQRLTANDADAPEGAA